MKFKSLYKKYGAKFYSRLIEKLKFYTRLIEKKKKKGSIHNSVVLQKQLKKSKLCVKESGRNT